VLGMPGFTAYAGMKVIGQPKPGETSGLPMFVTKFPG
jgi:NADPH-dependent curcumin reductase CurA